MKRTKLLDLENASRRQILKATMGGCAALTNTSLISTLLNMSATNSLMANGGDQSGYKAMVCLFMFGGNDSYNMLSPASTTGATNERQDYIDSRNGENSGANPGGLALPDDPSQHITYDGREFMIHPSMTHVKSLWDDDKIAFVCNIGSLVEPTTRADYESRSALPLGLFSHSDLQQHWMTSRPQSRSALTGWGGRMADILKDTNSNPNVSMNISLGSVNLMQTGGSVIPYVITDSGAQEVGWYGPTWTQAAIFTQMTDSYLDRTYSNLLEQTFAEQNSVALNAAIEFNQAVQSSSVTEKVDSHFSGTLSGVQRDLRSVARSIVASGGVPNVSPVIGQNRQSFFVSDGGYDNHDELINNQAGNLGDVSLALSQFQACMDANGLTDNVVLFTASDFARTLSSNGQGSDHGWGGNSLVMGGPVGSKKLVGEYPMSLNENSSFSQAPNSLNLGRGRLLPTTSVDELAFELACWYGIANDNSMLDVLPNIRNFVSQTGSGIDMPLGLFS